MQDKLISWILIFDLLAVLIKYKILNIYYRFIKAVDL